MAMTVGKELVPISGGLSRRRLIGVLLAGGTALALPACATTNRWNLADAIRRLLYVSSMRAFDRLTADGGYWDTSVAQIGLEGFLGNRGAVLTQILTSPLFKSRMERAFAGVAKDASRQAAPVLAEAVSVIGIENAVALARAGPTGATDFLRQAMDNRLIEAMVPEVGQALRVAQEPLVAQLLAALTGVDVAGVATTFSTRVNAVIWHEIGVEEAAIRANPVATNDPLLIGVFGAAGYL